MTSIDLSDEGRAARWLLSAEAVRVQAAIMMAACEAGQLQHFSYHSDRLDATADYVIEVMRDNYPDLVVPPHARWRHFVIDGDDRWQQMATGLADDPVERARIRIDLAVSSVLLDAGAGAKWRYKDSVSHNELVRSEGLAIASLDMFADGFFSADLQQPLRCDARKMQQLTNSDFITAFQVTDDNPLDGLDGRCQLINRLGCAIADRPDVYGPQGRIGYLADYVLSRGREGRISAPRLLQIILETLGPIWSGRQNLAGHNLGDCWYHPAVICDGATNGFVPLHKLSQWLAYSLLEPLQELGLMIDDLDGLTGLAEYRNGGLMIDCGLLRPRHKGIIGHDHQPDSSIIVEWRALTITLLDRLADRIRKRLDCDADTLPLAAILEGGTWAAGRRKASEMRDGGSPPLNIISDGSVF